MAVIFKPDWSVNIANIGVVVMAILGGVGAWYDVKSDTRINSRDIAALQLEASQHRQDDKSENVAQDNRQDKIVADIKGVMKDNKDEIKAEIRDLRNDLIRTKQK